MRKMNLACKLLVTLAVVACLVSSADAQEALPFGQTVSDSITTPGQTNTYQFSAAANDVIDLAITRTSGGFSPSLRVFDSQATLVCSVGGNCYFGWSHTDTGYGCALPTADSYTLLVQDGCGSGNVGDYNLYLQRVNVPSGAIATTFGNIASGTIAEAVGKDTYALVARAGAVGEFAATITSGNFSPRIRVYDSTGALACATGGNCYFGWTYNDTGNCPLSAGGSYAIMIDDGCGNPTTGDYNLTATCLTPPCTSGPSTTTTTTTTPASTSTTTITSSTSTTTGTGPSTSSTTTTTATTGTTSSATTSPIPSTTTSTLSACGNGTVDPGEECDPGDLASPNRYCCTADCKVNPIRIGLPCGPDRPLDVCEVHEACDGQGRCVPQPKTSDTACRTPFTSGPCDTGDNCDGIHASCPTTNANDCAGLPEQPPTGAKTIAVTCTAPATESRAKHLCSAQGFAPSSSVGATAADVPVTPSCNGKAVTVAAKETLKQSSNPRFLQRTVTLTLNANGRRLLRRNGALQVCVLVTVRFRGAVLSKTAQIVELHR